MGFHKVADRIARTQIYTQQKLWGALKKASVADRFHLHTVEIMVEEVLDFCNACGAGARQRKALSFPQAPYLCTGAAQRWGAMVIRILARGRLRQWVVQAHF